MNRKFTKAEAIQLADKLDASEANFYAESSLFFDRDLSGAVGDATEMLRAWPDDSKLLQALESIFYCCDEDHAARDYASRQAEIRGIAIAALRAAKGAA